MFIHNEGVKQAVLDWNLMEILANFYILKTLFYSKMANLVIYMNQTFKIPVWPAKRSLLSLLESLIQYLSLKVHDSIHILSTQLASESSDNEFYKLFIDKFLYVEKNSSHFMGLVSVFYLCPFNWHVLVISV